MDGLKAILQRAHDRQLKAGSVSKELIYDLRTYRKQQMLIFVLMEVILICGVFFSAYYLTSHPSSTSQLKALAGVIGIGTGGGIEVMRRIWKEWSQSSLLLLLISEATQAQITELIDRLMKKL